MKVTRKTTRAAEVRKVKATAKAAVANDEALTHELANFKPSIDASTVEKLETIAGSKGIAQSRRLMLAALSKSADELSEISIDSPDIYRLMLNRVENFGSHAEALHKAATSALLRLKIADCTDGAGAEVRHA